MDKPTPEQMAKLPKWAQRYIGSIERQRDTAIGSLNEYKDQQTPSPFYFDDLVCTGKEQGPSFKRVYVQTHRITVEYAGIRLDVLLRGQQIDLAWSEPDRSCSRAISMIPSSHCQVILLHKDHVK